MVLFINAVFSYAQSVSSIKGKVISQDGKPFPSVSIKVIETNQYISTNTNGEFIVTFTGIGKPELTFEFSHIGFKKQLKTIKLSSNRNDFGLIVMQELNLSLEAIDITAKRNCESLTNSSLIISRDVIERTPALSLLDLLNYIPNKKITAPSLQTVQNITLRSAFASSINNRGVFNLNNAFGVAVILNGNAVSNNMNMQSYNPGISGVGMGGSLLTTKNNYGLNDSATKPYSGDYTFGGTDLRQIPAENIESIEVISGVAPARYGDLTDGALIVELQAGVSPAFLNMQLRDNATSYAYSQGFKLPKGAGGVNLGLNYVNSFADNRDKIKAYQRVNASLMHSNSFGKEKRFKNTLSFDYKQNLDGIKSDPDDITKTAVKFNSWNYSFINRSFYRLNTAFFKNISLNIRYSEGHQISYREQFRNEPYQIISEATTTGIHEGSYVAGIYTAESLIDGRPINASAKLGFNSDFKLGDVTHFLEFGISYDYGANKGLGQVLDPSKPRAFVAVSATSLNSNRSERYYDFALAMSQQNVGLHIEDVFKLKVFNHELNVRGGFRYDLQNSFSSYSPRFNVNYALSKNIKIGLAYGLAFKAPSLAHRYPGPVYSEIPLLNAYNGKAAESTYLTYVNRYDPDGSKLKPIQSQIFEITSQIKHKNYNFSLTVFSKQSRKGINTVFHREYVTLPVYAATPAIGQKPVITQTGTRITYFTYLTFANDLVSDSQGIEIIAASPQIKTIATGFSLTGGLFKTTYRTNSLKQESFTNQSANRPDYAVVAFYEPDNSKTYLSNASISSNTHIPKISLVVSLVADFAILQKTIRSTTANIPLGYLTRDGRYLGIINPDLSNLDYGHLIKSAEQINEDNLTRIIPNFHLSLAKEFKKRFRFAFNVYNAFNYQPYYLTAANTYKYPNTAPSFGAQISLKL